MAITIDDIPSTIDKINDIAKTLNTMRMLLNQASDLAKNGWVVDIGAGYSIPVTITLTQRLEMIAKYDDFKAQLVTKFQTLP